MTMTKHVVLALVLSFVLVLSACAQEKENASVQGGNNQVETQKPSESSQGNDQPAASGNSQSDSPKVVDSLKITMVGGSAGGFWTLMGEGVGNILRQSVPNTQFTLEPSNGVANVIGVAGGKFPLGMAWNFEVKAGLNGEQPFPEKVPEVMGLVALYNNAPQQIVVLKSFADKYGITSLEDIAAKKPPIRVNVNRRGNLGEALNRTTFEAYGFTYDDIKAWGGNVYHEAHPAAIDMMKDNKLDLEAIALFAPDSKLLELTTSKEVLMLSVNKKAQDLLQERYGLPAGVIKAKTYDWQNDDITTSNGGAILLADPNMSVDEAYTITKAMVENIDKYASLHPSLKEMTPEAMADVAPATMHPGAEMYFKEIGVLK